MNYTPDVIELLAGEYVIGTLHGPARKRFEKLLSLRADVRHATWAWEQQLQGLCTDIEPVRPPRSVWRNVRRRIGNQDRKARLRPRLAFAGVAVAIAVFAFWLGALFQTDVAPGEPEHIAVFADESSRPLWVISVDADSGQMVVQSLGVDPLDDDLIHELWALPAGGNPRSLGLLRVDPGQLERTLAPALIAAVEQSDSLAISLEPAGGSPTGVPTGPVVLQASLTTL